MMQRRILVTGGAGFVARCLAQRLADNPENLVVVVDNLQTGSKSKLPVSIHDNVRFIKADVNAFADISTVFCTFSFDYVFHYAATVGVKRTLANPMMVLDDLNGIRNVLDLSKNTGVRRVYFSSSSEVYGEPVEFPQNEHTTPLNSRLPYAIVKNVGEAYLRAYYQEFGLEYTIFRFFNTYGPKQSSDFVMSRFVDAALAGNDITIYGDGSQTRTFCYIDDNVDATLNAFYENRCVNDVANIGSDFEISVLDLAKRIIEITGSSSQIVFLPALKEGDMTRRCPDISVMRHLLDRKMTSIDDGIRRLLEARQAVPFL
jgi:UDP-glucuronate decarboxylase